MRDPDKTRDAVAGFVAMVLRDAFAQATITETVTTSDCPLIRMDFDDGDSFHLTVTRARK